MAILRRAFIRREGTGVCFVHQDPTEVELVAEQHGRDDKSGARAESEEAGSP
jgi:hypothetical protein